MSFSSPCSIMRMLVKRSTTSPSRRLSNSGRAKFFGRMSFRRLLSFSIARIASSIAVPISGVCALAAMSPHRAPCGTKKIPSEVYSSMSSSKPSPSATSSQCFSSKRSEIYLRKISPSTTFLYSEASIFPRNTHAASHICFSKPMSAVVFSAIVFLLSVLTHPVNIANYTNIIISDVVSNVKAACGICCVILLLSKNKNTIQSTLDKPPQTRYNKGQR